MLYRIVHFLYNAKTSLRKQAEPRSSKHWMISTLLRNVFFVAISVRLYEALIWVRHFLFLYLFLFYFYIFIFILFFIFLFIYLLFFIYFFFFFYKFGLQRSINSWERDLIYSTLGIKKNKKAVPYRKPRLLARDANLGVNPCHFVLILSLIVCLSNRMLSRLFLDKMLNNVYQGLPNNLITIDYTFYEIVYCIISSHEGLKSFLQLL